MHQRAKQTRRGLAEPAHQVELEALEGVVQRIKAGAPTFVGKGRIGMEETGANTETDKQFIRLGHPRLGVYVGKEMVDRLTNLVAIFENPALEVAGPKKDVGGIGIEGAGGVFGALSVMMATRAFGLFSRIHLKRSRVQTRDLRFLDYLIAERF